MEKKYDVITLGGATLDVFVKTKNEIRKHEHHLDIAYHLGEKVLIDNLVFSTGGGGTNCAVAFSRLGLKTAFLGAVGNDNNGKIILADLKKEKVDFLGKVKKGNSGYSVILPGKDDRTILVYKGVANSLSSKDVDIKKLKTKWLYVSTLLGEGFETSLKIIESLKKQGVFIAMNISMYLAKQGIDALSTLLKYIDIIILNKEEAYTLTSMHTLSDVFVDFSKHTDALIVVTDGHNGVYACYNKKKYFKKIKPITPVDTTGAGDAFASGFLYGIIKGKSIPASLDYGHKEALSVLQEIGAKNNLLRKL